MGYSVKQISKFTSDNIMLYNTYINNSQTTELRSFDITQNSNSYTFINWASNQSYDYKFINGEKEFQSSTKENEGRSLKDKNAK